MGAQVEALAERIEIGVLDPNGRMARRRVAVLRRVGDFLTSSNRAYTAASRVLRHTICPPDVGLQGSQE